MTTTVCCTKLCPGLLQTRVKRFTPWLRANISLKEWFSNIYFELQNDSFYTTVLSLKNLQLVDERTIFTKWFLALLLIIFKILNHGQIISKFPIFLCWTKLPHRYFECLKIRQNIIYNSSTTKLQNFS